MERQKRTIARRVEVAAVFCLLACLSALGLQAATQVTNFDPVAATVGNARLLSLALTQYTQDYDERLPNTQTTAAFQTALLPYVSDPAVFVSRVTGSPFVPNPTISGRSLSEFSDTGKTAAFTDVSTVRRTPAIIAFLDGHVERGGIVQGTTAAGSYANAKMLALGVLQYTQDYDESYPPMKTQAQFQAAVFPYVRSSLSFIDPVNGKPFLPNPALSGVSVASVSDPHTAVLFQSDMPYLNGMPTIAYADGHVVPVPPNLSSTGQDDASQLKRIGLAITQYTQDDDGVFPETTNYPQFVDVLEPYLKDPGVFVSPGTGLPYLLNPAVSGVSITSINDLSNTEVGRDAQMNSDGTLNHLEADGHIKQDLYFVPKALAVAPDGQTHVLWTKAGRQASLWTVSPGGTVTSVSTVDHGGLAFALAIGADSQTHLLQGVSDMSEKLSVPITGTATLDTLGPEEAFETSAQFGPYDGWTVAFLTAGADNSTRLLWRRSDGVLALWTLSPDGSYLGSVSVPILTGGIPVGISLGGDGLTRLLWKTSAGNATLWAVSAAGSVATSQSYLAPLGETLTALETGSDGSSRLLWSDGKDHAAVLTQSLARRSSSTITFTLPGGGTAAQIAAGQTGDLRILWKSGSGSGQLQTITAKGQQTSLAALTPYE